MPLFFQVLASGSKGNSVLICSPKTRILVDAGLSGREITRRLGATPVRAQELHGLVITHEHQDHVRGAGVLSRRFGLPVYATQGTVEQLPPDTGTLAGLHVFQCGSSFCIGDLRIHPFPISHDAREPVGFIVEHQGTRLGICTDLGVVTHLVQVRLQGCHGLIMEANHDEHMLLNGPYPPHLKQRIRSRHGHLSNADALLLLQALYHDSLQTVVFAHLSEINNHPDLVRQGYQEVCRDPQWQEVRLQIGSQSEVSPGAELP